MRRHLIGHARGRRHAEFVTWEGIEKFTVGRIPELDSAVTVDRLLSQLAEAKPEWCNLVEVKYFLGLTDEEAAKTAGSKSAHHAAHVARRRQWLFEQMDSGNASQSAGR